MSQNDMASPGGIGSNNKGIDGCHDGKYALKTNGWSGAGNQTGGYGKINHGAQSELKKEEMLCFTKQTVRSQTIRGVL